MEMIKVMDEEYVKFNNGKYTCIIDMSDIVSSKLERKDLSIKIVDEDNCVHSIKFDNEKDFNDAVNIFAEYFFLKPNSKLKKDEKSKNYNIKFNFSEGFNNANNSNQTEQKIQDTIKKHKEMGLDF